MPCYAPDDNCVNHGACNAADRCAFEPVTHVKGVSPLLGGDPPEGFASCGAKLKPGEFWWTGMSMTDGDLIACFGPVPDNLCTPCMAAIRKRLEDRERETHPNLAFQPPNCANCIASHDCSNCRILRHEGEPTGFLHSCSKCYHVWGGLQITNCFQAPVCGLAEFCTDPDCKGHGFQPSEYGP